MTGFITAAGTAFAFFVIYCAYALAFYYGSILVVDNVDGMNGGMRIT